MRLLAQTIAIVAILLHFQGTDALAHGGATGVVKERMDLIGEMAKAMKSIAAMMKGKEAYDTEKVAELARRIAGHAGEATTKLFPEGSLDKPTESLPVIWTAWDEFTALSGQLSDAAGALAEAAGDPSPGGPAAAAFTRVAKTCTACHKKFRERK